MAYPSHLENNLAMVVGLLLPAFLWLGATVLITPLARRIVEEKRTGVKELMKMMGLPGWSYWTSWIVSSMVTAVFTTIIVVLLLCVEWKSGAGRVLEYSDPSLLFVFFVLFSLALIVSTCTFSTLFASRKQYSILKRRYRTSTRTCAQPTLPPWPSSSCT